MPGCGGGGASGGAWLLAFAKYVTMDSTLSMVQRLCNLLEDYLAAAPAKRFELLRAIRGDWDE